MKKRVIVFSVVFIIACLTSVGVLRLYEMHQRDVLNKKWDEIYATRHVDFDANQTITIKGEEESEEFEPSTLSTATTYLGTYTYKFSNVRITQNVENLQWMKPERLSRLKSLMEKNPNIAVLYYDLTMQNIDARDRYPENGMSPGVNINFFYNG